MKNIYCMDLMVFASGSMIFVWFCRGSYQHFKGVYKKIFEFFRVSGS